MSQKPVGNKQFRCPTELSVTPTPLRRVMVLGQCLMGGWPAVLKHMLPATACDFFLTNNSQVLPEAPPHPPSEYDFQVVQLPLRSLVPDAAYFRLAYDDVEGYKALFDETCQRLEQFLELAMRWNREHGILTFVVNFLTPQQNPVGRLLPRYDLRNFVYFVEQLNRHLSDEIAAYKNTYLFDLDQVVASFGRKYFQDDVVIHLNHNSALANFGAEANFERLEPMSRIDDAYEAKIFEYVQLAWTEILAMYRSVRQLDMVKLVVFDLDDTLWRGVAAERKEISGETLEGWPLGVAEALGYLKRRGVLLALLSKNEETLVEPLFTRIFGARLSLSDFAIRKINWKPKAENLEEIINIVNVTPRSVVYVDDNPVERASIEAAFPDIRTLGGNPLLWRRILLWSSETQVATITKESASRGRMMQAQVERETERKRMSREEFLDSLKVNIELREIDSLEHADFPRVLELVNKSNQFNTTGRRWTSQEFQNGLASDLRVFDFEVRDRYTEYGIVGVAIVRDRTIEQFVMSCRVLGLEVELAVVGELMRAIAMGDEAVRITADLKETDLNLAVRDLWTRCGFSQADADWVRASVPALAKPAHITLTSAISNRELLPEY